MCDLSTSYWLQMKLQQNKAMLLLVKDKTTTNYIRFVHHDRLMSGKMEATNLCLPASSNAGG